MAMHAAVRSIPVMGLVIAAALCAPARGQEVVQIVASPWSANVTAASQYISRGFRQGWGKPALQGGVDYAGPGGFAFGTWLSTISDRYVEDGTVEWDLYGTYTGKLGNDDAIGYSAGVYVYKYPGAHIAATDTTYDYTEVALGLTYRWAYVKYNYTVSREFFGIENARGTGYLDLGANLDLGDGYTMQLHAGQGRVANNAVWNWRDYRVGVAKVLAPGWTLSAAYTRAHGATDAYDRYTTGVPNGAGVIETSDPARGTFVVALLRTF